MLTVEQALNCDICGAEMSRLKQTVPAGTVLQLIDRGQTHGISQWKDVCGDCFGPLIKAFWAIKAGVGIDCGE